MTVATGALAIGFNDEASAGCHETRYVCQQPTVVHVQPVQPVTTDSHENRSCRQDYHQKADSTSAGSAAGLDDEDQSELPG